MGMAQTRERRTTPQRLSICSGHVMNNAWYETQVPMENTTACSRLLLRYFSAVSDRIRDVFGLSAKVNKTDNMHTFKLTLNELAYPFLL